MLWTANDGLKTECKFRLLRGSCLSESRTKVIYRHSTIGGVEVSAEWDLTTAGQALRISPWGGLISFMSAPPVQSLAERMGFLRLGRSGDSWHPTRLLS